MSELKRYDLTAEALEGVIMSVGMEESPGGRYVLYGEVQKRIAGLENDLLDALDMKEGRGPTALSMLQKRIAELEADNAQVCEWSCKDSDIMLYGGTCGTEWVFDQPPVGDYNYCPKCGRHLHISEGDADE